MSIKSRLIAIDFDDTFTADPELWRPFIASARTRGHRVICVTARRNTEENELLIAEAFGIEDLSVYFSNLGSKVAYMERIGVKVDIWIDDAPYALVHGH